MRRAVAILLLGLLSVPLSGQTPVERARSLRDAGDLAGAATSLEQHLSAHPDDIAALVLLAETRYWLKEFDRAVALYDDALARAPDDAGLRLAFGRTLVELQRGDTARTILEPLTMRGDAVGAEALFQLGRLDHWTGRLARARDELRGALERNPDHAGAADALRAIRIASAPWLRIDPHYGHDSQALSRGGASAGLGVFLTPMVLVALDASIDRYGWSDSATSVLAGEVSLRGSAAGGRLALEAGTGLAHWSAAHAARWTGRVSARGGLGAHASITASAQRLAYLNTTASLATPITPDRLELTLALDRPDSWIGETGVRVDRFADGNRVLSLWAWLLAPVAASDAASLRLGWQAGWQDARESHFTLAAERTGMVGTRAFTGRYVPYYTPGRVRSHGPAGALRLRLARAVTLDANGSWGLHAAEDAPFWFAPDTLPDSPPAMATYDRHFHPLEVRGALRIDASAGTALFLEATHARTAFYDDTRLRTGLLVRFLPGT